MKIEFFVPGLPIPKGSSRAWQNKKTGRIYLQPDNAPTLYSWQNKIAQAASDAGCKFPSEAVHLQIRFYFPHPKLHFRSNGTLKPWAQHLRHTVRPDLDKLIRSVLDGLTGVAFNDDSRVISVVAEKIYADLNLLTPQMGAQIIIEQVEPS